MRRIVVFLTLLALAAPLTAFAAKASPGDGTMSVRDLNGYFGVQARGAIVGRCDRCVLRIEERSEDAPIDPRVFGATGRDTDADGDLDRYVVRDGRWKIIGGSFWVRVSNGTDVDISLVGRGAGKLRGTAGEYSMNGEDFVDVPAELTPFTLRALLSP